MSWIVGDTAQWGIVAAKASLMYGTALIGLRLGERRTLAQWTSIDFAAAVAMGAIVGRTAVASDQSYGVGAVALLTLIALHRLLSVARFSRWVNKLVDHRIRLLVIDGKVEAGQLRLCGLTSNDLFAELRQKGVSSLRDVKYVLYETKGGISIVPSSPGEPAELIDAAVAAAAGPAAGLRP
jgi:uncharacterized membrane protein YcaP (DUF421 family)